MYNLAIPKFGISQTAPHSVPIWHASCEVRLLQLRTGAWEGGAKRKTGKEEEENNIIKILLASVSRLLRDQSLFLVNAKFWKVIHLHSSNSPILPSFFQLLPLSFLCPHKTIFLLYDMRETSFQIHSPELQLSGGICTQRNSELKLSLAWMVSRRQPTPQARSMFWPV